MLLLSTSCGGGLLASTTAGTVASTAVVRADVGAVVAAAGTLA